MVSVLKSASNLFVKGCVAFGSNSEKVEKEGEDALEVAQKKKEKDEEEDKKKSRGALSMIHLLVAFLLFIFMSLMVIESSLYIRAVYFFICILLFAVYNVVHSKGLELSINMLGKKGKV